MNKAITTVGAVITASFFMSQPIYALPNGKPFQELNALIEENATAIDANGELIEQNSTAILSLSSELSALDGRVGVLETTVGGLTTQFATLEGVVGKNTSDIVIANARIDAVRKELSELDATVSSNTQALADAEAALAAAEEKLAQRNADLSGLNDTVAVNQSAIADVEADIAAAEAGLAQLELDVVTNAAEIQTTKDNLNDLNASLASLQAIVDSNIARITQTEADIFAADGNIATLTNQYYDLETLINSTADASDAAIAALKAELTDLIEANQADIVTNKAELQALNADLLQLAQDNSAIAQDLRDQMLALALLVDSDSTSITALQTQVGTLSTTLTTLNAEYNSLSSLYATLKDHVDTHHDELEVLTLSLSNLSNRVDLIDPAGVSNPLASYSFTDEYSVTDIDHTENVRQFFIDTPTLNRWIYVMMNTPSQNKVSEICVKDRDGVFDVFKISGDHNTGNVDIYSYGTSAYRLNNGEWVGSQIRLHSRKDAAYSIVDMYATSNSYARAYVRKRIDYADYHQTLHSGNWWTVRYQQDTIVTYTIADDRLAACGY